MTFTKSLRLLAWSDRFEGAMSVVLRLLALPGESL
jgi:hypothetical protein